MSVFPKPSPEGLISEAERAPPLARLIREGKASARRIRNSEVAISATSRDTLSEWFDQAHRLSLARYSHGLKGTAFRKFAETIGIKGSRSYEVEQLDGFRDVVFTRCEALESQAEAEDSSFRWPGWKAALTIAMPYKSTKPESITVLKERLAQRDVQIRAMKARGGFGRPVTWKHDGNEWASPLKLFKFLDQYFHFDVDVCATIENTKCKKFFDTKTDGLKQEWKSGEVHYMNPPYSEAGKWVTKAHESSKKGAIVVALLANRSSTRWYRDSVAPNAAIVLLYGRIHFGHHSEIDMSGAPFASILAIWPKTAAAQIRKICTKADVMMMEMPR